MKRGQVAFFFKSQGSCGQQPSRRCPRGFHRDLGRQDVEGGPDDARTFWPSSGARMEWPHPGKRVQKRTGWFDKTSIRPLTPRPQVVYSDNSSPSCVFWQLVPHVSIRSNLTYIGYKKLHSLRPNQGGKPLGPPGCIRSFMIILGVKLDE